MPKAHKNRPATYSYPVGLLPAPATQADERPGEVAPSPPAASASRQKWVDYANAIGENVDGLTKPQIRKLVA